MRWWVAHVTTDCSDRTWGFDAGTQPSAYLLVDRNIDLIGDLQGDGDGVGDRLLDAPGIGAAVHRQLQAIPFRDDAGVLAFEHLMLDRSTTNRLPFRLAARDPQRGTWRVEPEMGLAVFVVVRVDRGEPRQRDREPPPVRLAAQAGWERDGVFVPLVRPEAVTSDQSGPLLRAFEGTTQIVSFRQACKFCIFP